MAVKIRETDLLNSYKKAIPEKRLSLMLEYYREFPGMLKRIESETKYFIQSEQLRIRSKRWAELDALIHIALCKTQKILDGTDEKLVKQICHMGIPVKPVIETSFRSLKCATGLLHLHSKKMACIKQGV